MIDVQMTYLYIYLSNNKTNNYFIVFPFWVNVPVGISYTTVIAGSFW